MFNRHGHKLLQPPFRINCRPERRERDAELFSDVFPPNRPPSRLPRDRALRAGEHKPIFFRWTLLYRSLVADRSIVEHTGIHREDTSSPKPSVKMAVRLFHGNNSCIVQQLFAQERRSRDGPYSGLPPDGLTGQPCALQALLSPVKKRLTPTAIPASGQPSLAKGVNLLRKTARL